jgi:hypothetical protein
MLRQNPAPVGQKLRVVMLTNAMGLETGPNKYMHTIGVLALWQRSALRACAPSRLRPGIRLHRREQQK